MLRNNLLHAALAALLCTPFALPAAAAAASTPTVKPATRGGSQAQVRYRVVDLGSLSGGYGLLQGHSVNRRGMGVGLMATDQLDPFCDFETGSGCFFDGALYHAFQYANGKTYDLVGLHEGVNSAANGITELGLVYGVSQTGAIDPATGWPEAHAVAWLNQRIINLGTLGGTQSMATAANLIGQTVGGALTTKANPYAAAPMAGCRWNPILGSGAKWFTFAENAFIYAPGTTETHATYWWGGMKIDMGTLGGPDSVAFDINTRGQAVGWSYASFQANELGVPDVRPFVWSVWDRKMHDLGSLGGACSLAVAINERGQVVGASTLADNVTERPFLWTKKDGMRDLGTLGGSLAHANDINDRGEVIGYSTMLSVSAGEPAYYKGRAFYWYKGKMTNLGTFGDDYTDAADINNRGEIVGEVFSVYGESLRGWISYRGGPIVDLNTLIDPNSGYHITAAGYITDSGIIGAQAILPNGEEHPVMLIPIQ